MTLLGSEQCIINQNFEQKNGFDRLACFLKFPTEDFQEHQQNLVLKFLEVIKQLFATSIPQKSNQNKTGLEHCRSFG